MSKGKTLESMLDMALEARMKRAKEMGYDTDFPLTHGSYEKDINEISMSRGKYGEHRFQGLFALPSESAGYGDYEHTFYPRSGRVADSGDWDLDYETSMEVLKKEYPDATDEQLELLYDISAGDKNIYNMDASALADLSGKFSDLAEASWEGQRLRGRIAAAHDYDAIAMSDENGTSYLIPAGSKARKIDAAFDPEKKDSSNIMASVAPVGVGLGASFLTPDQTMAEQIASTPFRRPNIGEVMASGAPTASIIAPESQTLLNVADAAQQWSDWRNKNLPAPVNFLLPGPPDPSYIRNRAYGREPSTWEKIKFGLSFL